MTAEDKIREQQERLDLVRLWSERITALSMRPKKPMSEAEFCRKYKFPAAWFNRHKNGGDSVPSKRTVQRVEKALKKEGV